jgi:membrane protein DedA with SNARE-associated domain
MLAQIFDPIVNFLLSTVGNWGYLGIFILMAIESSIIPVPSELVLIPAGVLIYQNQMSVLGVFFSALIGSIIGSLICYYLALIFGRKLTERFLLRYGKLFFIDESHLIKSEKYFEDHGQITVFIARLIPGIRHLISLPAGFSRMNISKFCLYTGLGAGLWSIVLMGLGYFFGGNMDLIKNNLDMITIWVLFFLAALALIYIYYRIKKKHN